MSTFRQVNYLARMVSLFIFIKASLNLANDQFFANNNLTDRITLAPNAPEQHSSLQQQISLDQPPPPYSDVVRSTN